MYYYILQNLIKDNIKEKRSVGRTRSSWLKIRRINYLEQVQIIEANKERFKLYTFITNFLISIID